MKRSPTDWLCICGKRHTGLPLDPEIWGEATAMAHRPVSIYEARMANIPGHLRAFLRGVRSMPGRTAASNAAAKMKGDRDADDFGLS